VKVAIARSRTIHTVTDLNKATGLHPNTIYDLFNGAVEAPGCPTMAKIAKALEVPLSDLWATWQGLEPEPDSVQEALRRHTQAMTEQNRLLGELVRFVRSAAGAVVEQDDPLEDPTEEGEAQLRASEADRRVRERRGSEEPSEPPVPDGKAE
jgi:DNA-binding Xre family transcriptional regulator